MCATFQPAEKDIDEICRIAYARTKNTSDAEDIMQDVFLRYLSVEQPFASEEHRKAWFIRVTVNVSNRHGSEKRNQSRNPFRQRKAKAGKCSMPS